LNSPSIFDKIFSDEFILDIIGALECMISPLVLHISSSYRHIIYIIFNSKPVKMLHFSSNFSKLLPVDDPEVAKVQKHRTFLKDHVIFKEVG
jgi:protein phosphatase-4 regulatory subunit 3